MLFNSYQFILLFLPVTLVIFFVLGRLKYGRMAMAWLVLASLFFYGWWNPYHVALILLSIGFNYAMGYWLSHIDFSKTFISKKGFLTIGVAANLILLGYYKYLTSLLDSMDKLLSTGFNVEFDILIPLAISFFTFQQIAYLVDVYRNDAREESFLNYCLFVTFFPQLISGPIVHHQEMLPQFAKKESGIFNAENLAVGVSIFTIGLFKKVVLADNIAAYVDPVFSAGAAGHAVTFIEAWEGTLLFNLQIYFDFSGYADMAIGAARMFNIHIPINFNSPFKATGRFEFWRRWNMTLGRFMRYHVYLPIAHGKNFRVGNMAALIITIILGAIWHGAGLTFFFWGVLQALYLLINHYWRVFRKFLGHNLSRTTRTGIAFSVLFNTMCGSILAIFFRASDLDASINFLRGMFGRNGIIIPESLSSLIEGMGPSFAQFTGALGFQSGAPPLYQGNEQLLWILFAFTLCWFFPNTQEIMGKYGSAIDPVKQSKGKQDASILPGFLRKFLKFELNARWAIIIGTLFICSLTFMTQIQRFIYFQF